MRWRRPKCSRSSSMRTGIRWTSLSPRTSSRRRSAAAASKLTGWDLKVMTQDQVAAKSEAEQEAALKLFMDKLEVDQEIANILVQEGFSTVEEIAYVPTGELLAVEGFDEDIVEELRSRAKDALLTEALAVEENLDEN